MMSRSLRTSLRPLAAILSGTLLVFAFPGWNIELIIWLWMLPLLAALWLSEFPPVQASAGKFRRLWQRLAIFRLGYLAGLAFFLPNLCWLRHSSRVINGARGDEWMGLPVEMMGWGAVLGMSGILSIYFGLWAWFTATIARPRSAAMTGASSIQASLDSLRSAALSAAAWVMLEWMRGWVLTGFGWNGLSVALYQDKVLIQAADLVGVCGLSFLPVFASVVGFNVVHRLVMYVRERRGMRYHFDLIVMLALVLSTAAYGMRCLSVENTDCMPVRVALVQQNVPQADKFNGVNIAERYQRYAELTHLHAEARDDSKKSPVELVVWPESALALPLDYPEHKAYFDDLMSIGDYSLLTGCDLLAPAGPSYTSAALFHQAFNGAQIYNKVHLVPFGEYLPLRPSLGPVLGGVLPGDFAHGMKTEPLQLLNAPVQVIPLICFEDTDGNLARQFLRDEPQLIANLTNDGWFLQSAEPEQHLANAIFRTIELRLPMCRATNTGVTCFIDDRGRITSKLTDPDTGSTFTQGVLQATMQVPKHPVRTLYARWGDWFAKLCGGICFLAWFAWRRTNATLTRADETSDALP